jgi:5'-3' exonuclease
MFPLRTGWASSYSLGTEELTPYQDLMYEETSPIIDFYPQDFELDMNGKKQDWEAVVKIPFIDQERLLRTMASELESLPSLRAHPV